MNAEAIKYKKMLLEKYFKDIEENDKAHAIKAMHDNNWPQIDSAEIEYEWHDDFVRRIVIASGGTVDDDYHFDSWYFYYEYDKPTIEVDGHTSNLYEKEPFKTILENAKSNIIAWVKKNDNLTTIKCDEDAVYTSLTNNGKSEYSFHFNFKDFIFSYTNYETGFDYVTSEPLDILFILKDHQNLDFIGE